MVKKFLFAIFVLFSIIQISFAGLPECVELPPENQDDPSHPLGEIPYKGLNEKPDAIHPFCIEENNFGGGTGNFD